MPKYYFSSFNTRVIENNQRYIYNSITNRKIRLSDSLLNLSDKILSQQLAFIEESIENKLLQLIVTELIYKGIIIPEKEHKKEIEYLNTLVNFNPLKNRFFKCKNLTEGELALLDTKNNNRIIFCSIPYDFGSLVPGTRFGPNLLRSTSESIVFYRENSVLLDLEDKNDFFSNKELYDIGNIYLPTDLKSNSLFKVNSLVRKIYEKGIPFLIGGDHLFSLPIIEAIYSYKKKPFTVVQLDYHLDVQLWGKFKDNKPFVLTEATHANFISWLKLNIPELSFFQLGVNNYQSLDNEISVQEVTSYLKDIGTQISNIEILNNSNTELLNKLPINQDIYITIDVDVFNRIYIPNTGYPSAMGMNIVDLYKIVKFLCKNNNVLGVDIMEFGSTDKYDQTPMCDIILTILLQIIKNI